MSYQVLARKWRPRNFSEMVGQEHVLQALINSLNQQRLHHAYLFSGTRGVGKTTVARVLAKALNCERGISATPCEECKICQDITAGQFIDLIEVDAASRTKVEDTREILDNVPYLPNQGRFKIYLIDEVHMLSGHSFNALLKTLEEPPAHVKFLFATTEPQKLPVTILSRCLQFNLKNMLPEQINKHLASILDSEHCSYEPEALKHIARAANGSMRDALSLLDQALAFGDNRIEEAGVCQMLGYVEHSHILQLAQALAASDAEQLLAISEQLLQQGADFHHVLDEFLGLFHQLTVIQCLAKNTSDENAELRQLASQFSAADIQLFYQIALKGRQDIALSPTTKIGFDMTLLRMLAFQPAGKQAPPPMAHKERHLNREKAVIGNEAPPPRRQNRQPEEVKTAPPIPQPIVRDRKPSLSPETKLAGNAAPPLPPAMPGPMAAEANNFDLGELPELSLEESIAPAPKIEGIDKDIEQALASDIPTSPAKAPPSLSDELGPLLLEESVETTLNAAKTPPPIPSMTETHISAQDEPCGKPKHGLEQSKPASHAETKALDWTSIIDQLKLTGMALNAVKHTQLKSCSDNILELHIESSHQSLLTTITLERIKAAVSNYFNKPYQLLFTPSETTLHSPARKQEQQNKESLEAATRAIKEDPTVDVLLTQFDARLVEDSIQAKKKLVE